MDRQKAAGLIQETFNNPFDEDRFRYFTRNLFNEVDEKFTPPFAGAYIPDAYKEHIKQYKRIAKYADPEGNEVSPTEAGRYELYALQRYAADYYEEFEKPKIVWGNLATEPKFAYDSSLSYISTPANIIPTTDLYLLAIFNSPLCKWWISLQAAVRSGGFLEYKPMYVGTVPVFTASDTQKAPIIERVEKILADPESPDVPHIEAEINKLVYDLYGLTPEEIEIVEGRG